MQGGESRVRPTDYQSGQASSSLPLMVELTAAECRMYGCKDRLVEDFDVHPYSLRRKSFSMLSKTPRVVLRAHNVKHLPASYSSLGIPAIPELRKDNLADRSNRSRVPSINIRQRPSTTLCYAVSPMFQLRNGGEIPAVVSDEGSPDASTPEEMEENRESLNLPYLNFDEPSTSLQGRIALAPRMSKRRQSLL